MKQFMIEHRKSTTYHPQSNGPIEAFNKTLTRGLTKICNTDKDDWDDKILKPFHKPCILGLYDQSYYRNNNDPEIFFDFYLLLVS